MKKQKPLVNALLLFLLAVMILALVLIPPAVLSPIMLVIFPNSNITDTAIESLPYTGIGITIAMIITLIAIVFALRPDLIQKLKKK